MNISGRPVSNPSAIGYFSIKPSEKAGWISLEDFYDKRYTKNPKIKFTYEQLSKCRFRYRDNECKFSSFTDELPRLTMPNFYNANTMQLEYFCTSAKSGYCIRLLNTLDRYIQKARYETIKAATIFDVDYLNSDIHPKTYDWYYLQRCFYAENAIYSYYSTYEILSLLVWICKDYYLQESHKTFEIVSKKCKSHILRKKLQSDDQYLFNLLSEPNGSPNKFFAQVITWCNTFKHRGILRFEGERKTNEPTCCFIPSQAGLDMGMEQCSSADWSFLYIDLDKDVLPALIDYHKNIVETSLKIIEHCLINHSE